MEYDAESFFYVVGRSKYGFTVNDEKYNTWKEAKARRNELFKNGITITHCWVEKRWDGQPWNTKRYGEVLKRT